ncbi:MAG: hypothetical protein WCO99_02120 [Planctomycetota bacterium]
MTPLEVLHAYKRQPDIEKRFSQLKNDFFVAPVYLKSVRRIQAILAVYFFGLLVEALLEREARQAMKHLPGALADIGVQSAATLVDDHLAQGLTPRHLDRLLSSPPPGTLPIGWTTRTANRNTSHGGGSFLPVVGCCW